MYVVLQLPKQIQMSNNQTNCFGVEGADTKILNCTVDTKKKEITILNAFQYQLTNPGKISLKFEAFWKDVFKLIQNLNGRGEE